MSTKPIIPISRPSFGSDELAELGQVLESGWVTQGPRVRAFEDAFAASHDVAHAIAVTSCTAGLHLALVALGVSEGDEVLVPAFTWISTANVVLHCGARPVLVDVDPVTFNIVPEAAARAMTPRTRAAIPVHLFGLCADMDALADALDDRVTLIEDAACAVGAAYKGRRAGGLGFAGVFSFHPRKALTTGEGGMITTNDDAFAEKLRVLRNHGASVAEEDRHRSPRPYALPEFNLLGYNYRMTDLQGALGLVQVKRLAEIVAAREALARRYVTALADLEWLETPHVPPESDHGWQAFVCRVNPALAPSDRNALMETLQNVHGISTRPGTHAVHLQNYYRERFGFAETDFPGALECHRNSVALPMYGDLGDAEFERVVAALHAL